MSDYSSWKILPIELKRIADGIRTYCLLTSNQVLCQIERHPYIMPDPGFEPGAYRLRVGYPAVGRIRRVRQTGFEPAIYGLKARCHSSWLLTDDKSAAFLRFSFHDLSPFFHLFINSS